MIKYLNDPKKKGGQEITSRGKGKKYQVGRSRERYLKCTVFKLQTFYITIKEMISFLKNDFILKK